MKRIRRAGVIGAGVMGSGIAAHFANAGLEVVLLDVVPPDLDKIIKARPAAFFHKSFARLVTVGLVDKNLDKIASCDLVIEAVLEKIDVKRGLFEKLESVLAKDAIVASNTSGLRIAEMTEGRSASFKERFLVTHFFNPPRYMKLLEVVAGSDTSKETVERVRRFAEDVLGKGIVFARDTPNFIANRIGMHAVMTTIHQMLEDGLSPEDADAITGLPMAHPKSACFRTGDVVGIDTFANVADNCYAALTRDEERDVFKLPPYIRAMVERKRLGDKTKGGFYRRRGNEIATLDPKTGEYRARAADPEIASATKAIATIDDPRERVRKLVADPGKAGKFAWKVLSRSLAYAARRVGEIAEDEGAIDDAMKWGYSWELGPFETWEALGFAETAARMEKEGIKLPAWVRTRKPRVAPRSSPPPPSPPPPSPPPPVLKNDGAEARDLGDGILGVTFKTKANSLDPDVIALLGQAADRAERDFRGIVVANQGEHFSVGANLLLVVMAASQGQWDQIREMVKSFQETMQRLKYARVPVVAAPFGMTVGGGLELCFACAEVQAAAETYAGLVEVGVGLIPGGGGTMNMLRRALETIPEGTTVNTYDVVTQVFKNIALARVATSADEGKAFGYFRRTDGVSFDRARVSEHAKARCIALAASGYHTPAPRAFALPGESGIATLGMTINTLVAGGFASEHDALIARKLAVVLCGGAGGGSREVTEDEMLELEREAFVSLCGEAKSQERMQYMLMNNKPLRN
jgi:3-hydroxyacyl-CoA dehydrogenase